MPANDRGHTAKYRLAADRVAIDTGGTFTDCVAVRDGRLFALKVLSTPDEPGRAVLEVLNQIDASAGALVRHGTTVATNAMLERKGARIAFVTTAGFEDTLKIGRQARLKLYDWFQTPPTCLVPSELRFGVRERVTAEGERLTAIHEEELQSLAQRLRETGVQAIAISLLFSFANPENEREVASALAQLNLPLSVSHRILPEFREYERASTVTANAYLAPQLGEYLKNLAQGIGEGFPQSRFEIMQSSGGMISARIAAQEPVRTILSGPAGGVVGAYKLASAAGFDRIISFDMGGTSTDVCLVDGTVGGPEISKESAVAGVPIAVPMLDIHTAGAGGGSIARFDSGGMLHVGPESAGSEPGPICFGRGERPTVTDADLILGRLDPASFLAGTVPLDLERARKWMELCKGPLNTVEQFAAGILAVIESSMTRAIRVISVERGHDPRDFTLVAFGGGGPVHACTLARALSVPRVLIPLLPGALSAVGILLADTIRDYSRTVMLPIDASLESVFAELEATARKEFREEGLNGTAHRSVDLRYKGQGYELNIPFGPGIGDAFHAMHEKRYGFSNRMRAIEVVNVRVRMIEPAPYFELSQEPMREGDGGQALLGTRPVWFDSQCRQTNIFGRDLLRPGDTFAGPAIVTEYSSATVLQPEDRLRVDGFRNLVIEVHG